jgi:uncharacterized protein YbbC (DUF1343 family)/CubicO group peptidase (beta-lactamase class C family)
VALPTAAAPANLAAGIDAALQQAMASGATPSGVVLIRHRGAEILRAAYGHSLAFESKTTRAASPIDATADTLYDFASLTKLFTATCVLHLVEQDQVALDEPVARYLPDFKSNGKVAITVRQLLTHTSGLPALIELWKVAPGPEARRTRAIDIKPTDPPGRVFRYSDVGFMAVGWLVEAVSGLQLEQAVREWITQPLGLTSITFRPPEEQRQQIAATEDQADPPRALIWGEVHDPSAWSLRGVAGHAGLFGTARDLGAFGQSFLSGGLLTRSTVAEMTTSQVPKLARRGLGWELEETFYMGRLASPTTFGHTGFTGTSLVISPEHDLVVVLLTNRVHPSVDGPSINPTRQAVSNAALVGVSKIAPTLTGIDVLVRERADLLRGKRIGLITNVTGRDAQGQSTIDVLFGHKEWTLAALFSPEHGIRGDLAAGASVDESTDDATGLPIHSLYGATTRPTPAMLRDVDVLVYDIQDVGARTYTYISTLLEVLQAGLPVLVLDRPNPIGGVAVEGPVLDPRFASFVGPAPIAMRFGMTIGELARYFAGELVPQANLSVVPLQGWRRDQWFDQTGREWISPSPNLRSLAAATVYPGMVLFEGTTLSEGRGTDRPFEWIGAPGIDAAAWATRLNAAGLAGVRFGPAARTPESSKHAGKPCPGVLIDIVDRARLQPLTMAVTMLATAPRFDYDAATFDRLAGSDLFRLALLAGTPPGEIVASWQPALDAFRTIRSRYLLY